MPLKINLIQDLQAQELVKARDPMKFIYGGMVLLALIPLTMYVMTYMKESSAKSAFRTLESKWKKLEPQYKAALEQEKVQAKVAEEASSLKKAVVSNPLRANSLDVIRKMIPNEVELTRLRLLRSDDQAISVSISAVWHGDEAQRSIGQFYNKLTNEGFDADGYELDKKSVQEPLIGQITDPKRVIFEMTFKLTLKEAK